MLMDISLKKLLVITPYFAPQNHAAMFRVHKYVKYLHEFGIQPIVVTTDTNYNYKENPALLEEIPPDVEVHRTRFIETTVRGVAMALGRNKGDAVNNASPSGPSVAPTEAPKPRGALAIAKGTARKAYQWTRRNLINIPDPYISWYYTALPKCLELIEEHDIEMVYTTAAPYTTLMLGAKLKELTNVRWVCDMRDPLIYAQRTSSTQPHVFMYQRAILKRAFEQADLITHLSSSYVMIFRDMFGDAHLHKHHFIPTGVDEVAIQAASEQEGLKLDEPYLLYSGEFLVEYRDFMFSILERVIKSPRFEEHGGKFVFVGSRDINEPMVRSFASPEVLEHILFVDQVHQSKLYRYLLDSNGALLISGDTSRWAIAYAKLMDFLALEIPTIALVPDPSEAHTHLSRSGLGVFLSKSKDESAEQILDALARKLEPSEINHEYCARFLARRQVGDMAKLLTEVTSAP